MIDAVIVEVPNDGHPHGVRGVGEVPNAVGMRFRELPMSPPKVLSAFG